MKAPGLAQKSPVTTGVVGTRAPCSHLLVYNYRLNLSRNILCNTGTWVVLVNQREFEELKSVLYSFYLNTRRRMNSGKTGHKFETSGKKGKDAEQNNR